MKELRPCAHESQAVGNRERERKPSSIVDGSVLEGKREPCREVRDEHGLIPQICDREDDGGYTGWKTHDPTTLNSQGNDHGPQYRSVIFHHSDSQRQTASAYLKQLDASGAFRTPIVTEITPFKKLWLAEPEHQDYYRRNASGRYCQAVIVPKLLKFQAVFSEKIRN